MSAFESSPVHCLKLHPWGKRHNPGNEGAAAILHKPDGQDDQIKTNNSKVLTDDQCHSKFHLHAFYHG
jgi:hypothetical protein